MGNDVHTKARNRRQQGTTLIELIITLLVLGIAVSALAASLPSLVSLLQDRGDQRDAMSKLNECAEQLMDASKRDCDDGGVGDAFGISACSDYLHDKDDSTCGDDFCTIYLEHGITVRFPNPECD